MTDKSVLMEGVLDRYGVKFNAARNGEQSISCPNTDAHSHGDRNPSCSLNLGKGVLYCQGCGLSGDAYSVVMALENIPFVQVMEQLGKPLVMEESDWLIF